MRYSEEHKETVRARIVEAASRALREHGLSQVSIPALMKRAGLTHGGFYAHFRDRDELVSEAVRFAANETREGVFEASPGVEAMLDAYLSEGHRQHPEQGCVLAALGTEAAYQQGAVRRTFTETARGFLRLVESRLHPGSPPGEVSDEALALAARMVGALVLARLVRDETLAARLLAAGRRRTP